ncbi:MAG: NRDE family protein [Cyclobacteriaceae bacterium]
MCLIAFNWKNHPEYKLILVANRDEYYERPTASLHQWEEGFYAGKDLKAGGTWMGFHPSGKFAALTNFRDMENEQDHTRSRGDLVKGFLEDNLSPIDYLKSIGKFKSEYNGFSLIVADGEDMWVYSNYGNGIQRVSPGLHAISNAFLDTPWPKVGTAKSEMERMLKNPFSIDDLLDRLQSRQPALEANLPATGLNPNLEKAVSAQLIQVEDYYGTVNTTALLWKHDGNVLIKEKRIIPETEINQVKLMVN